MNTRSTAALIGFVLAASTALTGVASAQSTAIAVPSQVIVSYADLNLSSAQGAKILMQRISTAAAKACGHTPDLRDLGDYARFNTCKREAFDHAVRALNASSVALAAGQSASRMTLASR